MKLDPSPIPIPDRGAPKSELTRMVAGLECGQSVLCDVFAEVDSVRKWMRRNGRKIAVRKMDGGWRVWRTE